MDGHGSIHARQLDQQLLMRRRENLLDLDILVDDARDELHNALAHFRAAVAARDAEASKLADLVQRMAA